MIIETALVELAKAGGTELFISSSESLLKKVKTAKDIKQLFINTGEFFVDYENDADQLFDWPAARTAAPARRAPESPRR